MEFIFNFVKNIVAITIILNMVECLMSSSEYCKYIRLFTGILIIIGILSMLLNGAKKDNNLKNSTLKERNKNVVSVYKRYENKMDKRLEHLHKDIVNDYEKCIDNELSMLGIELENLRIKEDNRLGEVEEIYVKIKMYEGGKKYKNIENKTTQKLNSVYKDMRDKENMYKDTIYKVISKYYVLDYSKLKVAIVN